MSYKIPEGFEENLNLDYKCIMGEKFISLSGNGYIDIIGGYHGLTVRELRDRYGAILLTKINKPLTLEGKLERIKLKARQFVKKNIQGANSKTIKKFEEVFSREDDFGL